MSVATLLVYDRSYHDAFAFEHAMAHRNYMAIMAPLDRFGVMPYFIEPLPPKLPGPASMWAMKHQRAHDDFRNQVPENYNSATFGLPVNQNLVDLDLNTPEGRTWWTFTNNMEHFLANDAMSPLPTGPDLPPWYQTTGATYPFW